MIVRVKYQSVMCYIIGYILNFLGIATALQNLMLFWKIPILSSLITPMLYGILIGAVVIGMIIVLASRWKIVRICVLTALLLAWITTALFYPENTKYMWTTLTDFAKNPTYIFWFYSFALFLFSGCVSDVEELLEVLEKFAKITVVFSVLYYVVAIAEEQPPEYMNFSYSMQSSVALLLVLMQKKSTWSRVVFGIAGGVLIFIAGCRGAMLGLLISAFVYDFFSGKKRTKKEIFNRVVLVFLVILLFAFRRTVLETISEVLKSLEISSRTLEKLLEESLFDDSGRSALREKVSERYSLIGVGLFGDRVILGGTYVHNIIEEALLNYGLPLGIVLIGAWLLLIVYNVISSRGEYRVLLCSLVASGFVKMFLSSSYLHWEPAFWLLLGMSINFIYKKFSGPVHVLEHTMADSSNKEKYIN